MIIVKLAGGLGNQMFQYACGKALALRYATRLALDHSFLEYRPPEAGYTFREFELNAFGIDARITPAEMPLLQFPGEKRTGRGRAFLKKFGSLFISGDGASREYAVFQEDPHRFDDSFFESGPDQYLDGYFQREEYFVSAADTVRRDFTFVEVASEENARLMEDILSTANPVSVHVRRGDFLTIDGGRAHGVCFPSYYAAAMALIKEKIPDPFFFVFSADDPEWARATFADFDMRFRVVGEQNVGIYGYEDMRMMSLCKHNIVANSSFSWWGAWLNRNPEKLVIAPSRWYQAEEHKDIDPAPPGWIRLS